jgi:beta-phosphoglucomutase family hydrolase
MAFKPGFEAVVFDLDGVITKTALVHATAWKKMFDEYLRSREERMGEPFREFTHAGDYLPFVDGKPRYKGVSSFLESREIGIPYGDPGDDPEMETVCGLGNRKNIMFNRVLNEEGVETYASTLKIIHDLKKAGVKIGVASSSKNCRQVLEKAGLLGLFETRVDGVVSAEIGLKGKPEPDIFTTACANLGVSCHRAIIVEDAVSGVEAGKKGNFGLVLGIAREENALELLVGGADIVVEDLGEIGLEEMNRWFEKGMEEDAWRLRYFDYDMEKERSRETLLAVGNGYFGTRGALEESSANRVNYPGTYVSGLFNRLVSKVGGRDIENEDFVNIPNWVPVSFCIEDGPWFEFTPEPSCTVRSMRRTLDMKGGELKREMTVEDAQGRITKIESSRFASMADPHRAGLRYELTPVNYEGRIGLRAQLCGNHVNAGVERYKALNQKHLEPVSEEIHGDRLELVVKTTQSGIRIALASRITVKASGEEVQHEIKTGNGWVRRTFWMRGSKGRPVVMEKMVSLYTSRDPGAGDPLLRAMEVQKQMGSYREEMKSSAAAWKKIWDRIDVRIGGDREAQRLVRLHLFHMMVSASEHHAGLDAGIAPRGLHGEAYRGHIFWDELYMLPLYNLHFPEVVKSVLMYRYRRLDAARSYAREYGYEGAMFPWQSGSDGKEETQVIHLNPLSGEWGADYSSLQRHISLAIAYNVWGYFHASGDLAFMDHHGAEILLDICKFWVSAAKQEGEDGRYHIGKVMGPDEFHEKLPGAVGGGLTDNAYSNIMVSWMLDRAFRVMEELTASHRSRILEKLSIGKRDLDHWKEVMKGLSLGISDEGIIEQFRGYFGLAELDWDHYREQYGDIHRLDRILKAEGRSPDAFKLSKQADLLMSYYNLGEKEVDRIIRELGYRAGEGIMAANYDYYIRRTSHGSTLSKLVHGRLAWRMGRKKEGWALFLDALRSDLLDIQGGTTGEGIHCGVMAGTVCEVIFSFGGLDLSGNLPAIVPELPGHWTVLSFRFSFNGTHYQVAIKDHEIKISGKSSGKAKIKVHICGEEVDLSAGTEVTRKYSY